jgi:histidyl-tRNA synthetase
MGLAVDWFAGTGKFKKAQQYAHQTEAVAMVILGPREWALGEVTVQWLKTDRETKVSPERVDFDFLQG